MLTMNQKKKFFISTYSKLKICRESGYHLKSINLNVGASFTNHYLVGLPLFSFPPCLCLSTSWNSFALPPTGVQNTSPVPTVPAVPAFPPSIPAKLGLEQLVKLLPPTGVSQLSTTWTSFYPLRGYERELVRSVVPPTGVNSSRTPEGGKRSGQAGTEVFPALHVVDKLGQRQRQSVAGLKAGLVDREAGYRVQQPTKKEKNNLCYYNYHLDTYHRSNQDTCLLDKPAVKEGDWVQSGDLLADSASSVGGELAIGHNIIVAYMPWEGYNYEDAILINQRLVYEDIYTSIHIERYEIETKETKQGPEQITRELPDINSNSISHLDKYGIARIGSWVEEGDILVGKVTPFDTKTYTANEKFIFELFNKKLSRVKDSSLRAPKGIKAHVINVNIINRQKLDEANVFSLKSKGGRVPNRAGTSSFIALPALFRTPVGGTRVGKKCCTPYGGKQLFQSQLRWDRRWKCWDRGVPSEAGTKTKTIDG
jgi:RNA polymerase Rpb2, domain 6